MIKHLWSIVCREGKIDANNNLSLIDCYDEVQFALSTDDPNYKKGMPLIVPFHLELVSLFHRDIKHEEAEISQEVLVTDPKGLKLGEFNADVAFDDGKSRMRSIVKLETMAVTTSGSYLFKVKCVKKGESKALAVTEIPLDVQVKVNDDLLTV